MKMNLMRVSAYHHIVRMKSKSLRVIRWSSVFAWQTCREQWNSTLLPGSHLSYLKSHRMSEMHQFITEKSRSNKETKIGEQKCIVTRTGYVKSKMRWSNGSKSVSKTSPSSLSRLRTFFQHLNKWLTSKRSQCCSMSSTSISIKRFFKP